MSFKLGNIIRSIVKPASETMNAESIQGTGESGGKTAESPAVLTSAASGKEELEAGLQHAAREKNDLLQQVNFLLTEVENLTRERDALIRERNDLGELRFRFEHERDVLQARVDQLESAAGSREDQDEINKLSGERDTLILERNMLGELRYRFEHERDLLQARVDQLESAIGKATHGGETDKINSLMAENELLTKQRNEYGELRYRLEHEKDLYRAECNRLRIELSNALTGAESSRIPPPLIIFQHLAKTAGTTLADILTRNLPFDQQLQILPSSNPTTIGTWPHEVVVEAIRKKLLWNCRKFATWEATSDSGCITTFQEKLSMSPFSATP